MVKEHYTPSEENSDSEFGEFITDFGEVVPLTVEEQSELLQAITQRHYAAQLEAGMLEQVVDSMPEEAIGSDNEPVISLVDSLPKYGIEDVSFKISYEVRNEAGAYVQREVIVPVAERLNGGEIMPKENSGYTQEQADLAFRQMDELMNLKEEGILSELSPDGSSIIETDFARSFAINE